MADDARQRRRRAETATPQPNAIVASAELLTTQRVIEKLPDLEGWQTEAWEFYDAVGEVRFAASWFANALSRCRLTVAHRGAGGDEPSVIAPRELKEDGSRPEEWAPEADDEGLLPSERAAFDQLHTFAGGSVGQGRILSSFGTQLSVPGLGYLVGEPLGREDPLDDTPAAETWQVVSADELRAVPPPNPNDPLARTIYQVKISDSDRDGWRTLHRDALVARVIVPHARFHYRADSPMRAALPVLRELKGLTQHVDASIASRLAGAGLLILPKEMTFAAPGVDAKDHPQSFVELLITVASTAIRDRGSAAANVPVVVQMPGELIEKVQHLTFDTPLNQEAKELRDEAIRRFAASIDLPAEIVMGLGDANHWTAWQIEESAIKLHIEPMLEAIAHALTIAYLHPALKAAGVADELIADLIVWFDTSELTVRPDRSGDAKDLYDRNLIGAKATRRETGFDEGDAPTPEEQTRKILLGIVEQAPSLAPIVLPLLGIPVDFPDKEPLPVNGDGSAPADGGGDDAPADGPPDTRDNAPPPPDDEAALLAAADGLVYRAVERVGGRITNALRRQGMTAGGAGALVHTSLDDETREQLDLDELLEGAWDRVPEIADRYGVEPLALCATLDAYTRTLIATGWPHSIERLADVLGAPMVSEAA